MELAWHRKLPHTRTASPRCLSVQVSFNQGHKSSFVATLGTGAHPQLWLWSHHWKSPRQAPAAESVKAGKKVPLSQALMSRIKTSRTKKAPNPNFADGFWQVKQLRFVNANHSGEGQLTFLLIHQISPSPRFGFTFEIAPLQCGCCKSHAGVTAGSPFPHPSVCTALAQESPSAETPLQSVMEMWEWTSPWYWRVNPRASVAEIRKRSRKAETRGYYKSYDL